MSAVNLKTNEATTATMQRVGSLTEVELEMINLFVQVAHFLNIPKSIGEIYGFLFVSPSAAAFEDIVSRIKISKGAASHGLKYLRSMGAVRLTYLAGERRDYYIAETDLRKLAAGFLREQVERHLINGQERLMRIEERLTDFPSHNHEFLTARFHQLKNWSLMARGILPMITTFLGQPKSEKNEK